jgi:acyl-CoA thioesterase II
VPVSEDQDVVVAIQGALDDLLRAVRLEPSGDDRFRIPAAADHLPDRIFGGQLLAQAVVAAGATVAGKEVQSLHAAFVKAGMPARPVELTVARVRDGRTMATRQVSVIQGEEILLTALVSFVHNTGNHDVGPPGPSAPEPDETPMLQEWAASAGEAGRNWIERPPAVELRLPEPPTFMGGPRRGSKRSHWMRLPRPVDEGQVLHAALLAYASDYFLMDMIFRIHPDQPGPGDVQGFSVDHAIWFHRPIRFDDWHLYTQEAVSLFGDRGLARGAIYHRDRRLVATVAQEVVVRTRKDR